MRALRVLAAVVGASAVVALGGWLGAARAEEPPRPPRADEELSYERAAAGEIAIGDSLEVNGQPMQLSVFYTADPPDQVIAFYAQAFASRGVTPVVGDDAKVASVAGFDPKDGLQRFITALPQPGGQTLALVGVTNPRRPPRFNRGAEDAGFPVPPEHRAYLGYRSTDGSAQAESGQFVSTLSPREVFDFYRRELPAQGFAERTEESTASLAVFAKGAGVLSIAVQALADERGAAVFVNRTSAEQR